MARQFGPGTVTFDGGNFECEVSGGSVTHSYTETEKKAALCDTSAPPPTKQRGPDGLKLSLVNDLTDSGLYAYIHDNDLATVAVEYTPNTASGASWAGDVVLSLPDEIGAGAWGDDIESEVEFTSPSQFVFTAEVSVP